MFDDIVDIHSHTLWGMDDGASNFDEAVEMCLMADDTGTHTLFLTPHLMYWDKAEELYDLREMKVEQLAETLDDNFSGLILKKGFEILCDDEIFNIKYFKTYTLNDSRYLLIEFDFFKTSESDVVSWCNYITSFGLVPIIAHPERYNFVLENPSCVNKLSEIGALFQINAGSPAGMFGEMEADVACEMMNKGYGDFIGSDAHSLFSRNTDLFACIDMYPEFVDAHLLEKAAVDNPQFILNDKKYVPKRLDYISNF